MQKKWNTQKPTQPGRYLVTKIDRWDGTLVLDIAEWYAVGGEMRWNKASEVIAWMSLPEPYKGRERKET